MNRYRGFVMVLAAGTFWGLSGTVAQKLFQDEGFTPGWLVSMRMLLAGVLLLALCGTRAATRAQVLAVWKDAKTRVQIPVFGILGMLGVQYTYFASIHEGNAALATLLQYLAPLFVTVYQAFRMSKMPTGREFVAVFLALLGTFLLVTNGSISDLSISTAAVVWGILSAVALAFYTIYPSRLLSKWDSSVIVGWGMVIGGFALSLFNHPWQEQGLEWSVLSVGYVAFVILFGTLLAFYLYVDSLRFISPTETSLLAIIEPLVAVVASIVWLKVPFTLFEGIGGVCILGTVAMLSLPSKKRRKETDGVTSSG